MKLILIMVAVLFSAQISFAAYECPPEEPGCSEWVYDTLITNTDYPTCDIMVIYKYRQCTADYQFHIIEKSTSGNCDDMEELWSDPQYLSAFNEWLDIVMMEKSLEGEIVLPPCPGTSLKATFFEASCVVPVKCTYTVVAESRVCEEDYLEPYPDYEEAGDNKVDIWKLQPCGVTCCKKTFQICEEFDTNGSKTNIYLISKEQVGPCTNPDGFTKPCTNGC